MRNFLLFLFIIVIAFTSCTEKKNDFDNLDSMRKDFWNNSKNSSDIQKASLLDSAYKAYITNHPEDTVNPQLIFEDAKLHLSALNNTDEGLKLLERLYTKYPQSPLAPEAIYQSAFLLENDLQLTDEARQKYQLLIDKYPNHQFAKEAQVAIKYVGKSPEEMLKAITDSSASQNKAAQPQ